MSSLLPSRSQSAAIFLLLFLAAAAVVFFREPGNYLLPRLAYEDGRDMFGFFYNHREPGAMLRFYNGYVSVVPNLAGYLLLALPTPRVPLALAALPLLLAALAYSWLALPAYRWLIADDGLRYLACLALALLPVGNYLFISNTTYSVWHLFLILIWLSLAPPPSGAAGALGRGVAMAALICSHPLSVALIPVYLITAWLHRRRGVLAVAFYAALTAIAALYQVIGVRPEGALRFEPVTTFRLTAIFTLERVVFDTLFGDAAALYLRRIGKPGAILWLAAAVVVALAAALIIYRHRLAPRHRWLVIAFTYLIVASTALYVIGRAPTLDILAGNRAFRYFWVQRLLFVALLFVLLDALWRQRLQQLSRRTGMLLLGLFAAALAVLNFHNNEAYKSRPRLGREVAAFTAEVARQEAVGAVDARLERGFWSIELKRTAR